MSPLWIPSGPTVVILLAPWADTLETIEQLVNSWLHHTYLLQNNNDYFLNEFWIEGLIHCLIERFPKKVKKRRLEIPSRLFFILLSKGNCRGLHWDHKQVLIKYELETLGQLPNGWNKNYIFFILHDICKPIILESSNTWQEPTSKTVCSLYSKVASVPISVIIWTIFDKVWWRC